MTNAAISLQREMVETIDIKLAGADGDVVMVWPSLSAKESDDSADGSSDEEEMERRELHRDWKRMRGRHATQSAVPEPIDLAPLPPNWAVVSISVTDDRNTLFITRHQNGHQPIVFCIPLDRQGRRENEDDEDIFSFDRAVGELQDIIAQNDDSGKVAKTVVLQEAKVAWWQHRIELDARLGRLLQSIEQVWLGAFKSILSTRVPLSSDDIARFRDKLQKPFVAALAATSADMRQISRVQMSEPIVECFATLSSKSEDEEVEDLVYFVLDVYQFHGVPVAMEDLDIDRVSRRLLTREICRTLTERSAYTGRQASLDRDRAIKETAG